MSNATQRNFGAAQRERNRRVASSLEGSMPIGSLAVTGDPGWDAFFGSLHDKVDEAGANGMGFRADLSSLGRYDMPMASGPSANEQNIRLGQLTDANAVRQLAIKRAVDEQRDAAINDMQRSYQEHVLNSVGQPREEGSITTETTGPDGKTAYSIAPSGPDTRSDRQRMLDQLPGALRAIIEPTLTPLEQKDTALAEASRHNKALEDAANASTLSGDALDDAADYWNQTGKMPALGQKDPGNRAKILNRAAERRTGGSVAANTADYKADSASLTKLQQQRDAVGAFEETALKNLDVFLDLAKKIPDTGSPALNKPLRALSEQGLGSADLAAYNAARRTVIPEFAKILSNPTLSGQLSDSARKEVEDVISGGATLAQTMAIANTLKTDAANRRTAYDDQLKTIRGRISGSGKTDEKTKETPEARLKRLLAAK